MNQFTLRWVGLFACVTLVVGCDSGLEQTAQDDSSSVDQEVVGGRAEAGYPSVGYLMSGVPLSGPRCGATVINARAIVSAAHCLYDQRQAGIGFGAAGSGQEHAGTRIIIHPKYQRFGSPRYHHDVAVVLFDHDLPAAPMAVRAASSDEIARYVGYGRVTPGSSSVVNGYTNERKSALSRVAGKDSFNLWTTTMGGGLCWGDSGGPLVSGNSVYGVLADFDGVFDCQIGNRMIFTSLAGEEAFLNDALSCLGAPEGAACRRLTQPGPVCQYTCADSRYTEGQCVSGWQCRDGCVTQNGCRWR